MLDKLKNAGISESGKERVRTAKDGNLSMQSTFDHIQALFDLSELDEDEKYVLANLSLIPHTGISTELFCEWCEIEGFDTINNLAMEGWARWDKEKDYISVHPLLSELIFHALDNMESLTSKYVYNVSMIKFWNDNKIANKYYVVDIFKHSLLLIDKYNFRSESAADFLRKVSTRIEHYEIPVNIERYYKKALSIRSELFGENSGDVATSHLYLAKLYDNVGSFSKAEKHVQIALKIRESIYGNLSDQYMLALFELAHILAWQEKYLESEKTYLQVEQYFMEAYDENTKTVLNCKLHLGDLYSRMKQYDKAIEVLQNCLTKKQLKYGTDSLDSATVHYSLSVAYRDSEKIELSINHGEKALSIRLLKLNENHPSIAQSYSSLGMTYLFFNEFDKAEEYLLRALEIRKKIFGEEHQRTARSYFRLGLCFEQTKRYPQSIEHYKSAIHIWNVLLMNDYMDKLEAEKRLCELQKTIGCI
jgi:tetratricopeptide (TPR) repeat protein